MSDEVAKCMIESGKRNRELQAKLKDGRKEMWEFGLKLADTKQRLKEAEASCAVMREYIHNTHHLLFCATIEIEEGLCDCGKSKALSKSGNTGKDLLDRLKKAEARVKEFEDAIGEGKI